MRKITILLFIFVSMSVSLLAAEAGVLSSSPSTIIPNQSVLISYDGTGTNFANWTPQCFIHVWLVPKTGMTFTGNYAPIWIACNGDADYANIDAKYKMIHDGVANSGKYSITIPNLYTFFSVLEEDKTKIDKLGVIVRAQYSGSNNQTVDFLLSVGDAILANVVSTNADDLKIAVQDKQIQVTLTKSSNIELYSVDGRRLMSEVTDGFFTCSVNKGLYLLKVNNKTHRVLVS